MDRYGYLYSDASNAVTAAMSAAFAAPIHTATTNVKPLRPSAFKLARAAKGVRLTYILRSPANATVTACWCGG